jgi:molybdopterin converting factor subunit 1
MRVIHVTYFAALRDATGFTEETLKTEAKTVKALFQELAAKYRWPLSDTDIRFAINDRYHPADTVLNEGDKIVFIPPVAGG